MERDKRVLILIVGLVVMMSGLAGLLAGGPLLNPEYLGLSLAQGDDEGDRVAAVAMLEQAGAAALGHVGAGRVVEIEIVDEENAFEVEIALADGSERTLLLDRNYEVVDDGAESNEEDTTAITAETLNRASSAALDHTGGGRVMGIEIGDGNGVYEIDVTMDDGDEVEVLVDENFEVVGQR